MRQSPALRASSPVRIFTDGVLFTFGPVWRHRLLITPNATSNIANLFVYIYGEDKVIWF